MIRTGWQANWTHWLPWWAPFVLLAVLLVMIKMSAIISRWRELVRHIRRYGSARATGPRRYRFDERGRMRSEDGERWE